MIVAPARSRWVSSVSLLAAIVLSTIISADAEAPRSVEPPRRIEINARQIASFDVRDASRRRFGELEYIGGLELTSSDKTFGELSAIRVTPDGQHFLSVSDKGRWFRGRILYQDGRPAGIADAETAPILGPDGRALADRGWFDTELLAEDGGTVYVGIERANQVVRFAYGKEGLLAPGEPVELPPRARTLPFNSGLETLVFVPRDLPLGGTLIAISERGLDAAKNIIGFLVGGPAPGEFTVRRTDDFDVTDAAVLPGGDLIILERRFSPARGVAMRIRRIAHGAIKPGAVLDGPALIEADLGYQIDNMEGLAVHRGPQGDVVLTIISDDNFNVIQRNILLQFRLLSP